MGAALLLLLVLISFLMLSRRASQQERRLDSLQNILDELSAENKKLQDDLALQNKRMQALELSYNSLNENLQKKRVQDLAQRQEQEQQYQQSQQNFTDFSQDYEQKIKALSEKLELLQEQQQKALLKNQVAKVNTTQAEPNNIENINTDVVKTNTTVSSVKQTHESSSEDQARKLIKSGMGLNEVASRTGLSSVEIDMIANMLAPVSDETEQLPPPVGTLHDEFQSEKRAEQDSSSLTQKTLSSSDDFKQSAAYERKLSSPHHVASLKARNAYGMSLRHQR